jgi:uridine kinase
MVRWQPARSDVLDALAEEILQNYSTGRVRVAIDGDETAATEFFADDLAAALTARGTTVARATEPADDAVVEAFRTETGDSILLVDGDQLLRPHLAGRWNFSVWVEGTGESPSASDVEYVRQVAPRAKASAIVDNRDPLHPRRVFADSC